MKYLMLLIIFSLLAGCLPTDPKSSLAFKTNPIPTTEEVDPDEKITFETLKNKILTPYCIACHKGFAEEKKLLKKVEPGDPEESELFQVVKDGSMPKDVPPLTSQELDLVRRYIVGLKPQVAN